MSDQITWGEAFRESCDLCRNPAPLLQSLLPVQLDAPAGQLGVAYRSLQELNQEQLSVSLRPVVFDALRQVYKRIAQLPCSDADAGLVLTKDFAVAALSRMDRPDGLQGPQARVVVVAKLSGLPLGHFLARSCDREIIGMMQTTNRA